MTNTKYGKYIVQAHANKEERLGKVAHLFGGKHFGGTNFSPAWVGFLFLHICISARLIRSF
jgi:hypothetical protein